MTPNYSSHAGEAAAPEPLPFEYLEPRMEVLPPHTGPDALSSSANPHQVAARGFAQTFGLLPMMAFLTVSGDLMLHAADVVSAGLLIPFSAAAGLVLGFITFKAQQKWYGDDRDSALIKALIVGFLTAVPSPLPYMLFIPAGIAGMFNTFRRS